MAARGGFHDPSLEENRVSNTRSTTTARTVTVTERRELQKALVRVELTREEELVLRLRQGIPVTREALLEYRGQGEPELSAKLAMIEADALDRLRPEPEPADADLEGAALKNAIIARLRKL